MESAGKRTSPGADERDGLAGRTRAETEAAGFAAGADLAESSGLYRLLVESVQDYAIFALDPKGFILSWNAGAERLKGYRPEEIIGRHFSTFYTEEDLSDGKPARELRIATETGKYEEEGWRLRKDGTLFWANVVITALRDESGTLVGFAKVTRDLTERRLAEQQVRESEERFRLLVQEVRDYAIFLLNPDGTIASWNEGAQRIKGYTADEIIGRHFSTFYTEEDLLDGKPPRELRIATETGKYEEEGWRVRKDGSVFWANVLITALRNPAGQLIGFTKVTRDLTERRAAQERAIEDARRLAEVESASRTKSEFLRAMSHELRTPINATLGYAQLLELGVDGEMAPQQLEYLERIRHAQQHLLRIVNDLLDYGRIEAGRTEFDIQPVGVAEIVANVVPMVEPQAVARQITLLAVPPPAELTVMVDAGRAEQILLNLLSNAVKFTPADGRITITCEADDERAYIHVADTGVGIPAEALESVFEPFVQLGRSLTSSHEGSGLGLAISRDLVRGMGGELSVESEVGKGSVFTLALPRE